jgi:hypothetical protein
MTSTGDVVPEVRSLDGEKPGATAVFPFDRMTVERFRKDFPRARWRDDLHAWFVPGTTAERRLNRWLGRELSGAFKYADERGRDAFVFDPIESPYLQPVDDLVLRTPYSRTIVAEMRSIAWARWDEEIKAWRVPYRSLEELRRRWPLIVAAALRNTPEARRQKRRDRDRPDIRLAAVERRRRRFPVPADQLPPFGKVSMTLRFGAVIFAEVTGELVDEGIRERSYSEVAADHRLIWAHWRKPTLAELVAAWPSRSAASRPERERGWWRPDLKELRSERRAAKSAERARATRTAGKMET